MQRLLPLLLAALAATPVRAQDAGTVVVSLGALLLIAAVGFVCCWYVCMHAPCPPPFSHVSPLLTRHVRGCAVCQLWSHWCLAGLLRRAQTH